MTKNRSFMALLTLFSPIENHIVVLINELVESFQINEPYLLGLPREYNLVAMMKLVLFAYTRETFSSHRIERLAKENLYAYWLTQERASSYRTIARFCVSNDVTGMDE
ncbi:hypothetical protein IGI41_002359 [Enterococcus sp. DIV0876]